MNRLSYRTRVASPRRLRVLLLVLLGFAAGAPLTAEPPSPAEGLEQGEAAFPERFVVDRMEEAIAGYEAAERGLDSFPIETQAHVLNRLAQLTYEQTTREPGEPAAAQEAYRRGKAYGLRSLRLNPRFTEFESSDFEAAVAAVADPAALLWTADNWGALFDLDPLSGMLHLGKVRALYERSLALDDTYWGASAHNALGAMLIITPPVLGGDEASGRDHLERAVSLAPSYLQNRVVYARSWGFTYDPFGNVNGVRDAVFVERQLEAVLDAPIGGWPFWNRQAKREARILLDDLAALAASERE